MASYKQQEELLNKLSSFGVKSKTNFNKQDNILHEIKRHRETQASNIRFRNNIIKASKRANYMSEYDRLQGSLSAGLVSEPTNKYSMERMDRLKELGEKSITDSQHPILNHKKEAKHRVQNIVNNTMVVTPRSGSEAN